MAQSGSFIPQQQSPRPTAVRRRRVYIISYIIYTVFIGVLITAAGLFVWGWRLEAALAQQQNLLDEQRNSFSQSDIVRVQDMEARLNLVTQVLDNLPAASKVFTTLEESTVNSVQLSSFSISAESAAEGGVLVSYTGLTDSFDSVMAQRAVMEANPLLAEAQIVNVTYGASQREGETAQQAFSIATPVTYEVTLRLPVSSILYDGRVTTEATATDDASTVETQDLDVATSTESSTTTPAVDETS